MSGACPRPDASLAALTVVLLLLLPTAAAGVMQPPLPLVDQNETVPLPEDAADPCDECTPAPLDDLIRSTPIDRLPDRLWALAVDLPRQDVVRPDAIPGYDSLAEPHMRQAWQIWTAALAARAADPLAFLGSGMPLGGNGNAAALVGAAGPDIDTPRGLANLWRVEAHGVPREVLPADDAGATFLVTSAGILRFDAPGAPPAWMVKPGGYVSHVRTTDANGDGQLDVVLSTFAFNPDDDVSITILDGLDGSVIHRGFSGTDYLAAWTLTDLDGDGVDEIIGLDRQNNAAGFELDGTRIYGVPVLELPSPPPVFALVVFAWVLFYPALSTTFGDIDGDGVQDLVVSSFLYVIAVGFLVAATATNTFVSAYSGVDGSVIWRRSMQPSPGYSSSLVRMTGDFDGDGRDDVLASSFSLTFMPLVPVFGYQSGFEVLAGADGRPLANDRVDTTCVVVLCASTDVLLSPINPIGFLDLDRDGAEELLTLEVAFSSDDRIERLDIVARGPAPTGLLPSMELYRHSLELPRSDLINGAFRLRDVDADGDVDLMLFLVGVQTDDDGNVTDTATTVWGITEDGPRAFTTPNLFGMYDVNAITGQAFAWTLPDDRWVPLDEEGETMGRGMRIVLSPSPAWTGDENGDGIPDLLLHKGIGFMWVDGRTGRLLDDVERPVSRYAEELVVDDGRLRVLERGLGSRALFLADLETGQDVWKFDESWADRAYLEALTDVTGDGRHDLALSWWGSDDNGYREELRVLDMRESKQVMQIDTTNVYPIDFGDVVLNRTGDELLVVYHDYELNTGTMRVYVPGVAEPLWSYGLGSSGDFDSLADGMVLVRIYGEGLTIELVDGATGTLLSAHAVAANSWSTATMLEDLDGDGRSEAIVSYHEYTEGEELPEQHVAIYKGELDEPFANFSLGEPVVYQMPIGDQLYRYLRFARVEAAMGDWDGDSVVDLAFTEGDTPTVRSTIDGRLLAVAPVRGLVGWTPDMNGDGILELGVLTDQATLRLFASASVDHVLEPESSVQLLRDPEALQAGEESEFFSSESSSVPAPGVALVALLLVGLALVLRRRR